MARGEVDRHRVSVLLGRYSLGLRPRHLLGDRASRCIRPTRKCRSSPAAGRGRTGGRYGTLSTHRGCNANTRAEDKGSGAHGACRCHSLADPDISSTPLQVLDAEKPALQDPCFQGLVVPRRWAAANTLTGGDRQQAEGTGPDQAQAGGSTWPEGQTCSQGNALLSCPHPVLGRGDLWWASQPLRLAPILMRHNESSQRHLCSRHDSEVRQCDQDQAGGLIGVADSTFGTNDVREKVRGSSSAGKHWGCRIALAVSSWEANSRDRVCRQRQRAAGC